MKILKDGKEMYTGTKILFECDRCECMFTVAKKICGYCEKKSLCYLILSNTGIFLAFKISAK